MQILGFFLLFFILSSFVFSLLKSERAKKELYGYDIKKRINEALFCQSVVLLLSVVFIWIFFDAIYGNGKILVEFYGKRAFSPFGKLLFSSIVPLAILRMFKLFCKARDAKKLVVK